ncbi:hypothetical protein BHE74_00028504 [Ensete ventricosum]|nr:hypothetical protein BHE74_00028504 [Ensete ventricosum]
MAPPPPLPVRLPPLPLHLLPPLYRRRRLHRRLRLRRKARILLLFPHRRPPHSPVSSAPSSGSSHAPLQPCFPSPSPSLSPPQDPPPCSSLSSSLSPSLSPPQDPPSLLFFLLFTLGLLALVLLAFVAVHVYIAALWHLASVVSVLEPLCNLAAMAKSCDLLRGRALMASALVVAYLGACGFIGALFLAPVRTAASKSPACPSRFSSVVLLSRCSLLSVLSACSCKACSTMCARATTTSRSTRAHCLITWVAIRGSTFRSRVPFSDGKLMSERKLYAQVTIPAARGEGRSASASTLTQLPSSPYAARHLHQRRCRYRAATASTSMPMQMPNDIYINVVHASTIASASMPTYLSDDPFVILHLRQLLVDIDDVAQSRKSH